jgi:Tfp pilus assembly protein PilX
MNERGIAVPVTLIMLLLISTLGIALSAVGVIEPGIARNLQSGSQARLAAEAGIEWGHRTLTASTDWNALLATGTLASGVAIPGTSGVGTYTVTVRNDTLAADAALTGVAADTGGSASDTNGYVIVQATGVAGSGRRTVVAAVRRIELLPGGFRSLVSPLSLPGNEAQAYFTGDSWRVDGNDYNMDGTTGTCSPRYGMTARTASNETVLQNAVSSSQKDNVLGLKQNPSGNAWGDNTIAVDSALTPAALSTFVSNVAKVADIKLNSTQAARVNLTDVGASCATDWNSSTCWGTAERPKVIHVKGDPDPTSNFTALQLNGSTTGYGVLIVEDGDLRVYGALNWKGTIIVTGQYVGVGFFDSNQTVYGAVISNETAVDPGFYEGVVQSNAQLRYSCQALDMAQTAAKLTTIRSWKEL